MPFAFRRAALALTLATLASAGASAQQALPTQVDAALARAKVPRESVLSLIHI